MSLKLSYFFLFLLVVLGCRKKKEIDNPPAKEGACKLSMVQKSYNGSTNVLWYYQYDSKGNIKGKIGQGGYQVLRDSLERIHIFYYPPIDNTPFDPNWTYYLFHYDTQGRVDTVHLMNPSEVLYNPYYVFQHDSLGRISFFRINVEFQDLWYDQQLFYDAHDNVVQILVSSEDKTNHERVDSILIESYTYDLSLVSPYEEEKKILRYITPIGNTMCTMIALPAHNAITSYSQTGRDTSLAISTFRYGTDKDGKVTAMRVHGLTDNSDEDHLLYYTCP